MVFVASADGSHPVNLTNNGPLSAKCPLQLAFRPKWSADGTKFVFMHYDCEGGGLWLMNVDASNKHQLTSQFEEKPDWGTNQE